MEINPSIEQMAAMEMPLNAKDYKAINDALYRLNRYEQYCRRAENAGLDCEGRLKTIEYVRTQLEKRKKVFFPGKP